MTATEPPVEAELTFHLDDEKGQIWAHLQPSADMVVKSAEDIVAALKQAGYGEFFILDEAMQQLVEKQTTTTDKIELVVAERRDADVTITVSDDLMQAHLTISPAYAGEFVSKEHIELAIRKAGIVEGLQGKVLTAILQRQSASNELIAKGTPATDGTDASLKSLLPVIKGRHPTVNKDGTVNLRELGQFIVVKPGEQLMRKTPLTYGSSGTNVHGQNIAPVRGQDVLLNALSGTRISPDDENILIARIAGQPLLYDGGIEVDPTLSVERVDLTTGNVDFDGSVYVTGNVIAAMNIKTTGDIFIEGSVEAARLEAGGDIIIKKGFIGCGTVRDEHEKLNSHVAKAVCGGRFSAKFIENVIVQAGVEVVVDDLISHCEVSAGENIVVGLEGGRGRVWGGVCEAGQLFRAHSVGSTADVKTVVQVGKVDGMKAQFLQMEQESEQKQQDKQKILQLINKLGAEGDASKQAIIDCAQKTLDMNSAELDELGQQKKTLVETYKTCMNAQIVVDKEIFNGVCLRIGMGEHDITDRKGPGTYLLEDNRITIK